MSSEHKSLIKTILKREFNNIYNISEFNNVLENVYKHNKICDININLIYKKMRYVIQSKILKGENEENRETIANSSAIIFNDKELTILELKEIVKKTRFVKVY